MWFRRCRTTLQFNAHPLPDRLVELIAECFRVLSEPMRIRLLDRLRDGEATGGELQDAVGASEQNVSKHLGVLLNARIVARSKRGTASVYSIADRGVFELCEQACGGIRRQVARARRDPPGGRRRELLSIVRP